MTASDGDQNEESESLCRVWWREAIRRLDAEGIIQCPDVEKLEKECLEYALGNQASVPNWEGYQYYVSKNSA